MEGRYGLYRQGSSGWTSMRNGELQEEDVWAVLKEGKDSTSQVGTSKESYSIAPRRLPTAARMIPRANNSTTQEPKIIQQSAPVNIPDWSKIYGKNTKKASKNASWLDDHDHDDDGVIMESSWDSDDDYDDDDGNMMPPHEWIAKKPARSQMSSLSVCEGAGRTLKGRDLSRVRNAVLTKTGFLE
uniref:Senescence regulator S40 n=1 Tax=Davidia involucrata TaxID=16924 RepID=A0A5B6YRU3_DAVIN